MVEQPVIQTDGQTWEDVLETLPPEHQALYNKFVNDTLAEIAQYRTERDAYKRELCELQKTASSKIAMKIAEMAIDGYWPDLNLLFFQIH